MKILWIVNTIFPDIADHIGLEKPIYGGWMYSLAELLSANSDIELSIATVHSGAYIEQKIKNKNYFLIPNNKDDVIKYYWKKIKNNLQPDVVHIHGTEYSHGLIYLQTIGNENVVFSIQGLVNVCERYYLTGLSFKEIISNITFRDIVRWDNLYQQKNKFKKRGAQEIEYFKRSKHVIGRTDWDRSHAYFLNKDINYHFCNEILRNGFYTSKKWKFENCEPYTIFLSQANYPIKGLHKVIEAVYLLKNDFPNIRIRVAGDNLIKADSLTEKIKLGSYAKYLRKKIVEYNISDKIQFIGNLDEVGMINEYLKANVFICPSSIENSPNSLAEAQLLGVPVISSYVGGTPNMIEHGKTGYLYRFEEIEMLAMYISTIFKMNVSEIEQLSKNSFNSASQRHDPKLVYEAYIFAYNNLAK